VHVICRLYLAVPGLPLPPPVYIYIRSLLLFIGLFCSLIGLILSLFCYLAVAVHGVAHPPPVYIYIYIYIYIYQ